MTDNSLTFGTSKSSNNAELIAVKRKLFAKEALVEKKPKAAGATLINPRINLWMKLAINDLISARVIKDPQLFTSPGTYLPVPFSHSRRNDFRYLYRRRNRSFQTESASTASTDTGERP